MRSHTLRDKPSKEDISWKFTVPPDVLVPPDRNRPLIKSVKFSAQAITLSWELPSSNRILQDDDLSKFIQASFMDLRFPESTIREGGEYIANMLKAGLFLNGVQYRFYHHSNSQLVDLFLSTDDLFAKYFTQRGRSCYLRQANNDAELDDRIYKLGDFGKMMNVAKRAKRIGLLFSSADVAIKLDPLYIADIPDIQSGDELFSDGCGLISRKLAIQLAKARRIVFRGTRYTPGVYQIRYLGYKGVLMLHPPLDAEKKHLVAFRKSMKKFSADTKNTTLSVVDYSQPYSFGRLNNDIIVLLSSLGVTNEKLLGRQEAYFQWISNASKDIGQAVDFLACLGQHKLAEKVLLDGLDDPSIAERIRKLQLGEVNSFRKNDKPRARMMIHKSRLIFGVCDPFKVLKEGEVHIRITQSRKGPTTPILGDVLVVRNPCLHPGDCLKLRAAEHPQLAHLVDCIVFASVARPGHHAAPSMSSGGDLDGDKYFVCWDPDLVPLYVAQSYDYPPNRERVGKEPTRSALVDHFASYNTAGLAKVASLHQKWLKCSPQGAMSAECQELNALHSQSVDGARIKIPDRLLQPPEPTEPWILDLLAEAASQFATKISSTPDIRTAIATLDADGATSSILQLLRSSDQHALSEYEIFSMAFASARRHSLNFGHFLPFLDLSALTTAQKYALRFTLQSNPALCDWTEHNEAQLWNSLMRSDILTPRDLFQKALDRPYALQRLYSSQATGNLNTFYYYLKQSTVFKRKVIILRTDERFSIAIFMRGDIPWEEEPEVSENIMVCAFMHQSAETVTSYRACTKGFRLHMGEDNFQLYNKAKGNTFIFINRAARGSQDTITTSIALQNISARVQKQIGRVLRAPVTTVEIHVVSNRDRVAHQLFDLWFEHVPTEMYMRRFAREHPSYARNRISEVDWTDRPAWLRTLFLNENFKNHLPSEPAQLEAIMELALEYHVEEKLFVAFNSLVDRDPLPEPLLITWMDREPQLVYSLLKAFPPDDDRLSEKLAPFILPILKGVLRSANVLGIAALVALEKLSPQLSSISLNQYLDLLELAALSIRPFQLAQEALFVLNDSRISLGEKSPVMRYAQKQALAITFDRIEESADTCPCDEEGIPRKQRTPPVIAQLTRVAGKLDQVKAAVRIDFPNDIRLHSHVRLHAASKAEKEWVKAPLMDGLVIQSTKGELTIQLLHPPPPELEKMDWKLLNAGSVATYRAMKDAVGRIAQERDSCCRFYHLITGDHVDADLWDDTADATDITTVGETSEANEHLNQSQLQAVMQSKTSAVSLIWGPPGTGKTETVVRILSELLKNLSEESKILMTASTHNAVDNVLARFVKVNATGKWLKEEQILRVATDQSKVNKSLLAYTIDARVGGDMNENNRLMKQALQRVNSAVIVFTTCAGAGLGVLRKVDFNIVLVDEASQITEPCALIPLVKGSTRAVLVGDHEQLRPTVNKMGTALQYDVSLLERLWKQSSIPRTMLNVQYRFPAEINKFPSDEFYEGKLQTGIKDSYEVLKDLIPSGFPWPMNGKVPVPTVFVQCSTEEEMGGQSKGNLGQVELVAHIISLLRSEVEGRSDKGKELTITVLTPYKKQINLLKSKLPSSIGCFTVDSFQGRESDIIIFSSVRCNVEGDIGFVEDERRLNVMWTRARMGLILIGDRTTLTKAGVVTAEESPLWKRAIDSCTEVVIVVPEATT